MKRLSLIGLTTALLLCSLDAAPDRNKAAKLMRQGNYKEAFEEYSPLVLSAKTDPKKVGQDLIQAIQCLRSINRVNEVDAFREKAIGIHPSNWRLLQAAAQTLMNGDHQGYMIAGEFKRGHHRGGGKWMNSYERDRVRALQLLVQGMKTAAGDPDRQALGRFYLNLANTLMGQRGYYEAWRLQYLSNLEELPDYESGYYGYRGNRGAPVDAEGNPVFHKLPKSWKAAETDGERWRWALMQAKEVDPNQTNATQSLFADFHLHQFGVQTMASYGWFFGRHSEADEKKKDKSGTWELHTLGENETIAKLATGIKRFELPDEFNYIRIYKELKRFGSLGQIFENRRQYPKAADYWRKGGNHSRVNQIIGNWGMFEPVMTQPSGKGATVEFRFRNGKKVHFEAHAIKVKKLLDDVKAYIKSSPKGLDWDQRDLSNLGYRIISKNQKQYLGESVAKWTKDLEPRPNHFDRRITVSTPLDKAGAYLLTARMEGGNTCHVVLWIADTTIVKKMLDKSTYFFTADAVTGQPIAKANLTFFGYRQEYVREERGRGFYRFHTREFAEFTDNDGQVILDANRQPSNHQWVITATTPGGRLAYLGFTGIWHGNYHDSEYKQTKTFVITDRPVYRPNQTVKFKFWIGQAQYDREGPSNFAGRNYTVRINNAKNEKVHEKSYKADEFGGFDGEFTLGDEPALGMYRIMLTHSPGGGGYFRVEEYKKPEFEVLIEAPKEPVKLGDTITAKIQAKYYFGAPVTEAKVKYKVLRSEHDARWYPVCRWDWFYGPGYWWFACDYPWWPGWYEWGCRKPIPWWWHGWRWRKPPEVVAEGEAAVGKDGTLSVPIDTSVAKAVHPDQDHRYEITAEVTDRSRRTIVGTGKVLVARKPFKVYAWVNRGHYRTGDAIMAHFSAQTLDRKPVADAKGALKLLKVSYKEGKPVETKVQAWDLPTNAEGRAQVQIKAAEPGQYRLSYTVTDAKKNAIEGGYVFAVYGRGEDDAEYRFNDIELITDRREYEPGEKVKLRINTNRRGSCVLLFVRPANSIYLKPKLLRLKGKSAREEIEIVKRDMPNCFVEAVTVSNAKVHSEMREIIVPPESRVLDVKITPSAKEYKPGEKATVKLKLTDATGEPFKGSLVLSMYDKSVEYISGGSNVPEIKTFFWKWRRHHQMNTENSLQRGSGNHTPPKQQGMSYLGVFGHMVPEETEADKGNAFGAESNRRKSKGMADAEGVAEPQAAAPMAPGKAMAKKEAKSGEAAPAEPLVQPTVRTKFADTALWVAALKTNERGEAEVSLDMPENLTTWKTRVWAMGDGTRCGEATAEVVTTKNLIVRLQAPRFFVQKDEVVLSANVHNYLKNDKDVEVSLELDGGVLEPLDASTLTTKVKVPADGEKRVDWRVRVLRPGEAVVRMKGLTDEESDAMQMSFPVYVHGMLKTESFCGVIRPEKNASSLKIRVPHERRPDETRFEIRYSPTLAMSMVDALPYLVEYPYGCTEQTLNRFLPTVITQKTLLRMGVKLEDVRDKITNLNAQEIGEDIKRMKDWKRLAGTKRWSGTEWVPRNPVFDEAVVADMVKAGLEKLTAMQLSDGGWGWFYGSREHSYPHTTAVVVHGLQVARDNDVAIVPGVVQRGIAWLKRYQAKQILRLENWPLKKDPRKQFADNLDALAYMVLVDERSDSDTMRAFLYRDRNHLSVYAKAMFGLALHKAGHMKERDMLLRNVEQFLVQDDENQTAYLNLGNQGYWWWWYGSENEAHAYYLKLLVAVDPKSEKASRLVKYLLNNRRHATYWSSTRDTAYIIEAFADYLKATGEAEPDLTVEILIDGKKAKEVKINAANLFSYDNKLVVVGKGLADGEHAVELRKKGKGPLYWNAYLTNFTLEDPITRAGLEVKVTRDYYKLIPVEKTIKDSGSRGQAVNRKVEKYERQPLKNLSLLKSSDLVEIELVIESKNDYEYIVFEDMKAAGFEPVALRSGYGGNEMGAYMELRDERVTFFVRRLARGRHSLSYRMRAEIPGKFSALPTKASAMYAPELKANSDEIKLRIED